MKVTYKGVEMESVSTDEILKVVRGLQRSATGVEIPVTINHRPKKFQPNPWTREEIEYLISNIDNKASIVKKDFPTKSHTKSAISTMFYAVKSKNTNQIGKIGQEVMKAHNLL